MLRPLLLLLGLAGLSHAAETLPDGFADTVVATGLVYPTAMTAAPDGRLFICQQWGKVRVFKDGTLLPQELVAFPADGSGDRGLLGITVDPDFETDQALYAFYTEKPASTANDYVRNRVSRITVSGDLAIPGSEALLVESDLFYTVFHNGGPLHFGPDGKLYVAFGDGEDGSSAQRMTSMGGKILRLNPDGSIPPDNPFVATTSGAYQAIWCLGLRDPFSFAFRPSTGAMFIDDVGQDSWEEIDVGAPGANFGWPAAEGAVGNPAYVDPLYAYPHGDTWPSGDCIAGGVFYEPSTPSFPSTYVGTYFFIDYAKGWIGTLDPDHGNATSVFATGLTGPVALCLGTDGCLYYATYNYNNPASSLHRIAFAGIPPAITSVSGPPTAMPGGSASWTVQPTGTQPLVYQWLRDGAAIAGATSATYTLSPVASTDNSAGFSVTVQNAYGSVTSAPMTLVVSNDQPPVCAITTPAANATYFAGQIIAFAGTATDLEDGILPPSAYTWRVDFITPDDPVAVIPPTSGITNGSFTIPTTGDPRTNVSYRITLTVVDSAGGTDTTSVDIVPQTVSLSVVTQPVGMAVVLGGFSQRTTPFTVSAVVGQQLQLTAMDPQILNGEDYVFVSWSDGGDASHVITVPTSDMTYTAIFRASVSGTTSGGSTTGSATTAASTGAGSSHPAATSSSRCGIGGVIALAAVGVLLGLRYARPAVVSVVSTSRRLLAARGRGPRRGPSA
jgi:glucose/arabinose dehydrogenase